MAKIKEKQEEKKFSFDESAARKIQELQLVEQSLQNLAMQKQAFQLELSEITNALSELKETKDEVYKIVGSIMVKSKKDALEKDLNSKKDILNLRIKNIEKQEETLKEQLLKKRDSIMQSMR